MTELRYIFRYVKDLLSHTDETWVQLRDPNLKEAQVDYMLRYYYWPLMGIAAICIFFLHGNGVMVNSKLAYDAPFDFLTGLKGMAMFAFGYATGPMLAGLIIREVFGFFTDVTFDRNKLELFVHYSISIVLLVDLFCAFLPSMTFLTFIGLYVIYVVWLGASLFLEVQSSLLRFFVFVSFLAIYFSSDVLQYALRMLIAR